MGVTQATLVAFKLRTCVQCVLKVIDDLFDKRATSFSFFFFFFSTAYPSSFKSEVKIDVTKIRFLQIFSFEIFHIIFIVAYKLF